MSTVDKNRKIKGVAKGTCTIKKIAVGNPCRAIRKINEADKE